MVLDSCNELYLADNRHFHWIPVTDFWRCMGIPWTQSMSSHDVTASTRLAEASWRRDNRLIKGFWCDKFVIKSVTDVLRTHGRFVNYGLTPKNFTNLLLARSTSVTDLITNTRLHTFAGYSWVLHPNQVSKISIKRFCSKFWLCFSIQVIYMYMH